MKDDRNYYRMLDDDGLINEGRDSMNELAIVLADRLSDLLDVEEQLDEAQAEIETLKRMVDIWQAEAAELQHENDTLRGIK